MTQAVPMTNAADAPREEPATPAVEVVELRKEFLRRDGRGRLRRRKRRVPAIQGVSFTMKRGETLAILGQNGSGKSTLVRLLSTLLLHDGGTARIFGHDVFAEPKPVRKLVNRVSVEASFFKKMSSSENRGEAMENLSRGMQQKVALARALLTSPVLLLLDEPTTGLDPRSKLEVQDFIREIRGSHDSTILLCTHDLAEAEALAERVGILDRGQLLALEPADDLKRRYEADTLEVAFFAATGRSFEEEQDEDDDEERGVFA